jgi:hypothetical protein
MRLDLVHQQIGLPARLLFGYAATSERTAPITPTKSDKTPR